MPVSANGQVLPAKKYRAVLGFGQKYTHSRSKNAGKPYRQISWAKILDLVQNPKALPKAKAAWMLPSAYNEHDARTAEAQLEHGRFGFLLGDIDTGSPSQEQLETALDAVFGDCERATYSTASATPEKRKWRFAVPLAEPILGRDYKAIQTALIALFAEHGITLDEALTRTSQIVFLPNVPPEKRDPDTGEPLFYKWSVKRGKAFHLTPEHPIALKAAQIAAEAAAEVEEKRRAAERRAETRKRSVPLSGVPEDVGNLIAVFNAEHDIAAELLRYGWEQLGHSVNYRSPLQTSGSYATTVYADANFAVSKSSSDAAAGLGFETGAGFRRIDPFEIYTHFEHSGDRAEAVKQWRWVLEARATPRGKDGKFTGQRAVATDRPAPRPDFVTVDQAKSRISEAVRKFIAEKPAVMAIAASPGAGKSRIAREILAEGFEGDVAFYAPTLDLAEEAASHFAELGVSALAVRGRLAEDKGRLFDPIDPSTKLTEGDTGKMCLRPKLIEEARSKGLTEGMAICRKGRGENEERCPHWDICPWVQQWSGVDPEQPIVRCMAHSYLHLPDGSGRGRPALHVVDEACWQGALGKGSVPVNEWLKPRDPARFGTGDLFDDNNANAAKAADLLEAARQVLEAVKNGGDLSELSLGWSAEEFREFAEAEDRRPMLGASPSADDTQLEEKLARLEVMDKWAGVKAALWRVLADALEGERSTTERAVFLEGQGDKADVIQVYWRRQMPEEPTLHLDADADPEILKALYPETEEIDFVRAELKPNAEIVQVSDRSFSKTNVVGTETKQRGKLLRRQIRELVMSEVLQDRIHRGGGVLCVATKGVVQRLFEEAGHDKPKLGAELWGAKWIWFGPASKGRNDWRDHTTILEIGREELPPSAITDAARSLWGDSERALEMLTTDEDGNALPPEASLPVLMADGSAKAVHGRAYTDARLRALQRQYRENAGRQAAERLRMAHSVGQKRWVRLNNVSQPTAPVTELVSWETLRPDRMLAAMSEGVLRQGFVRLSAKGLFEDAPQTFESIKAVERWRANQKAQGGVERSDPVNPPAPVIESYYGCGGVKLRGLVARIKTKGQRGPTPTPVFIADTICADTAKAVLETKLGELAVFEVVETLLAPCDDAVNDAANALESHVGALGCRPKVTIRDVESPFFVRRTLPVADLIALYRRRGFEVEQPM